MPELQESTQMWNLKMVHKNDENVFIYLEAKKPANIWPFEGKEE